MNFLELLICAKAGDNDAAERILTMYAMPLRNQITALNP